MVNLILASTSARRRALLQQLQLSFSVQAVDVDESPIANESADEMVLRLAALKSHQALNESDGQDGLWLAADTTVVVAGEVFAKPLDEPDGLRMLRALSGRVHEVITGVSLLKSVSTKIEHIQFAVITKVKFRNLADAEILAYWQTGEPQDKAGAYAIQGRGAIFVESIAGSYSNVVGLPLMETAENLAHLGLKLWND